MPVDPGIGRVWEVPGVTDAPGTFADVYHWLYLVRGDDLEVVVTCSALAQTDEAYWRPLVEGIEFLAREGSILAFEPPAHRCGRHAGGATTKPRVHGDAGA